MIDPTKLAIRDLDTGEEVTHGGLADRTARLAGTLVQEHGVDPGDRVAVLADNSIAVLELMLACNHVGAIFVPLNFRLANAELMGLLEHADPRVSFVDAEHSTAMAEWSGRTENLTSLTPAETTAPKAPHTPNDVHTLLYTTGTTGAPKGVMYTHAMTDAILECGAKYAAQDENSRVLAFNPFFHAGGLYTAPVPALTFGGTVYLMQHFDAAKALAAMMDRALGITHANGVPTHFVRMMGLPEFERAKFPAMKFLGIGSAPIPVELLEAWSAKGVTPCQSYGCTEAFSVSLTPPDEAADLIGTAGYVMDGIDVRLAGDGEVGEIEVKGPPVTPGYWRNAELTAERFTDDGYLRTGDVGSFDERPDGRRALTIVDRVKEMYISGGENVYPAEAERVIMDMAGVRLAAIIPVPHAEWGEVGLALVEADGSVTADNVIDTCRTKLAHYKAPHKVQFVDSLPVNPQGKIDRRTVKAKVKAKWSRS